MLKKLKRNLRTLFLKYFDYNIIGEYYDYNKKCGHYQKKYIKMYYPKCLKRKKRGEQK